MTNTKIKFVVVVESVNTALRDNEIRTVSFYYIFVYTIFIYSWQLWQKFVLWFKKLESNMFAK